ncbi:hypothetical protein KP509_23G079900 [Ceratopteris richardii]|nr:hypothetical protein KP509_23G079900 [Ceratopteris richardii]
MFDHWNMSRDTELFLLNENLCCARSLVTIKDIARVHVRTNFSVKSSINGARFRSMYFMNSSAGSPFGGARLQVRQLLSLNTTNTEDGII